MLLTQQETTMFKQEIEATAAETLTGDLLELIAGGADGGEEWSCRVTSPPPTCTSDGNGHITCTPVYISCSK
jgi:hypothetical protein